MNETSSPDPRTIALIGPGRAGSAVTAGLVAAGWRLLRVAGRTSDARSVVDLCRRFGAGAADVAGAVAGAQLVVIATPDAAISDVATAIAAGLERGALVVHLSGALGVDALGPIERRRADVELGALHPLQTLNGETDSARLAGSWAAVAGPPRVMALAAELGLRPFAVSDDTRPQYHAAACIASNHLVALIGQVERVAADAGVPLEVFEPLVRATVDGCFALGPARALTGPVARGDVDTVVRHIEAVALDEQPAYRALAQAAARLVEQDDERLRAVLAQ